MRRVAAINDVVCNWCWPPCEHQSYQFTEPGEYTGNELGALPYLWLKRRYCSRYSTLWPESKTPLLSL